MAETGPFERITFKPGKIGGRACIRGMRITVGTIVGLGAASVTIVNPGQRLAVDAYGHLMIERGEG